MALFFFSNTSLINSCRLLINNGLPQFNQVSGIRQKVINKLKDLNIPEKPKKPLTPYFRFAQDQRQKIVKQNPNLKVTQVSVQLAADWKAIDPSIKTKYENEYKAEMEEYSRKYLKYTENLTEEQKLALKEYNQEVKSSKVKREKKKKLRENEKPKRPIGAYMLFLLDQAKVHQNKSYPELMKELKNPWANLDPTEKSKYVEAANKAKEQYKEDLEKWEKKMIEEGNEDLGLACLPPSPSARSGEGTINTEKSQEFHLVEKADDSPSNGKKGNADTADGILNKLIKFFKR